MLSPEQIEAGLERILLKVEKPGRYVGGELNTVVKDWGKSLTKVALVFPDIYDIGVSNVGLKILYDEINQHDGTRWQNVPMPPGQTWRTSCGRRASRSTLSNRNSRWAAST